jgi:cephalosporin-C deacetylase
MDTRPAHFDRYWRQTLEALDAYPGCPEIDLLPLRSTDFATLYGVRLTSAGPYRLFGYLSVPTGRGPFPTIYYAPKYQSVLEIIPQGTANLQRSRYVTFALAARGQRNSDFPYAAMFPGWLTDGIEQAESYIFRGVAADGVRGLEFLLSRSEVDASRLVVVGNDLALVIAALRQGATHLVTTPGLFYRTLELAAKSQSYPLEEINDYLRTYPDRREAVQQTLAYYDLEAMAPRVTATTLLIAGAAGSALEQRALAPLIEALGGPVNVYESEQSSYKDGLFVEQWMATQCRIGDVQGILPEHWR